MANFWAFPQGSGVPFLSFFDSDKKIGIKKRITTSPPNAKESYKKPVSKPQLNYCNNFMPQIEAQSPQSKKRQIFVAFLERPAEAPKKAYKNAVFAADL